VADRGVAAAVTRWRKPLVISLTDSLRRVFGHTANRGSAMALSNAGKQEPVDKAKPFPIPKQEVWEAFKRVKVNQGAAGVLVLPPLMRRVPSASRSSIDAFNHSFDQPQHSPIGITAFPVEQRYSSVSICRLREAQSLRDR